MSITINTLPQPQLDLPINTLVNLNTTVTGPSYAWTLYDQPEGSSATLSSLFVQNPTITPDVAGSYLLGLRVQGYDEVFAICAVKTKKTRSRYPAAGEDDADLGGALANARGWATDLNLFLRYTDRNLYNGGTCICRYVGAPAATRGSAVYASGVYTLDSGLPEEDYIPTVDEASANSLSTRSPLGLIVGKVDDTIPIATNDLVKVCFLGPIFNINTSTFSTVGDPVYLGNTLQSISPSQGTYSHYIGRVLKVHATEGAVLLLPSANGIEHSGSITKGFTDVAATGVWTYSQIAGQFVQIDSSGGAVDMTFPAFTSSQDNSSGVIIRSGANLVRLLSGGSNFLYAGGTASPFSLAANGDSVRWTYRHSNTTIYLT